VSPEDLATMRRLHFGEGWGPKAVAATTGCAVEVVKRHLKTMRHEIVRDWPDGEPDSGNCWVWHRGEFRGAWLLSAREDGYALVKIKGPDQTRRWLPPHDVKQVSDAIPPRQRFIRPKAG
jgi:hypothetical protein